VIACCYVSTTAIDSQEEECLLHIEKTGKTRWFPDPRIAQALFTRPTRDFIPEAAIAAILGELPSR